MHSETLFKPIRQNLTRNRSGDLTDGLAGAWLFNETGSRVISNHASPGGLGSATMQTAPVWSGSPWGAALEFVTANSNYATIPVYSGFRPTIPFCIAARIKIPSTATAAENAIWTNDDKINSLAGITMISNATGGAWVRIGDNSGTGVTHRRDFPLASSIGNDTWASVAWNVYSTTSFKGFLNGAESTGTVSGTAGSLGYDATTTGSMGREDVSTSAGYSYYGSFVVDYIYLWGGRSLSNLAALQIAQDPYCIFENRSRAWIFVTAPAAGWPHKLNAVSNASISKICGVAKASISKVSGVA